MLFYLFTYLISFFALILLFTLNSFFFSTNIQNRVSIYTLVATVVFGLFTTFYLYLYLYTTVVANNCVINFNLTFQTLPFNLLHYWPFIYIYIIITLITFIYCFAFNKKEVVLFQLYISVILLVGGVLFFSNSFVVFFLAYESFLIPSFLILYNFAKTRKALEAAFLMFFWTQFGAIFLIFNFQYLFFTTNITSFTSTTLTSFTKLESCFLFWTVFIGFGVKFPVWPFYDWLPKAHVEASTNFSIFLSGVLVKFAFFGFTKYLINMNVDCIPILVYPFLLVGFLDASLKIYYQTDLKKIIAYATVIEMHWLVLTVINGSNFFWLAGFAMMISHAMLSANFFLVVDSLTRRFKTRLITEISGIFYLAPSLYFLTLSLLIVFLGFPGSLLFVSEFLFFTALLDLNIFIFFFLFFFAYFVVPSCFFKSWFLILFGFNLNKTTTYKSLDLNSIELLLNWSLIVLLFWFGLTFQFWF